MVFEAELAVKLHAKDVEVETSSDRNPREDQVTMGRVHSPFNLRTLSVGTFKIITYIDKKTINALLLLKENYMFAFLFFLHHVYCFLAQEFLHTSSFEMSGPGWGGGGPRWWRSGDRVHHPLPQRIRRRVVTVFMYETAL